MKDGFVRAAAAAPRLRVADCAFNTKKIIETIQAANELDVKLLVFPELSVTAATCGDLFGQPSLISAAAASLGEIVKASIGSDTVIAVGAPLLLRQKLYNCAVMLQNGRILGVVPKDCAADRNFAPAPEENFEITLCGQSALFGTKLLFCCEDMREFCFAAELGEELWAADQPAVSHAFAGASVIINLAADFDTAGKAAFRRNMAAAASSRLVCGYVYANAGHGESTTDLVFSGQRFIYENGLQLNEAAPFSSDELCYSELDLSLICSERRRKNSFANGSCDGYDTVSFSLSSSETALSRKYAALPFVPEDEKLRAERCEEILSMQAYGLAKRVEHSRAKALVIGLSGGLDSTLAILICVRALKILGRPMTDIAAITMPCFGTTARTRGNAEILAERIGARLRTIDIANAVKVHFEDIGHSADNFNVVFENAQARERTQILMDAANQEGGLVIGTGDLSELALGWATYNGDHMSMYGVNGSVPKTLIRYLVRFEAENTNDQQLREVLLDVLDTPVSPELLPAKDGEIAQKTEDLVGPYELHDFFLYYAIRCRFTPAKILRIAETTFEGSYDRTTLLKWLENFYRRFFSQQFKRSCLPDGPKVGSLTLSPRGDWSMPSDGCSDLWLAEVKALY
ncbi:MAG: NAD(+) synthase [Oscillospiraceae bacterium]|nr:NAD(+) synthase [Oscillospiraceae bacterium]